MRQKNSYSQVSDAEDEIEAATEEGRQSINSSSLNAQEWIKELRDIAEEEAERALSEATHRLAQMQDMEILETNPEKKLDLDDCYEKIKREKENMEHLLRTAEKILRGYIGVELPRNDLQSTIHVDEENQALKSGVGYGKLSSKSPTEKTALAGKVVVLKEREPLCHAWGILFFTIVMTFTANILAIYFNFGVNLSVVVVCLVSIVGQMWFVTLRSAQFQNAYNAQAQRALNLLDNALEVLDRSLLDPIQAILIQAECLRRVYIPVERLAYEKEEKLSSKIPVAKDVKEPLLLVPVRLTTKINQTKTAVTGAAADYLSPLEQTCCFHLFCPLLCLVLYNGFVMAALIFYFPMDTPRSKTDFTPYTLQPSIVEFAFTTLAALVSYQWTRQSRVKFQMNRHLAELENIANAQIEIGDLDQLISSVCKSGLPKCTICVKEFFTDMKAVVKELKAVESQKPNPGGFE